MDKTLRIRSNFYRRPDQWEGNGLNESYAQGSFSNGERFLVYPKLGTFYLEVDNLIVDRIRIKSSDLIPIQHPDIWLKYAKTLLDAYGNPKGLTYESDESETVRD